MATSTNYGWSEPDNTSLVKDGALVIRTLGDAIDTSLWNSGYGQAGKNKFINGAMQIAQRGTSITLGASGYTLDRYFYGVATAVPTGTISQQIFTPGAAPVAGYEGSNFLRVNVTANNGCTILNLQNYIEDVRILAGQTATFSFWAKADAASTLLSATLTQNFGSGGSSSVNTTITLNTSRALTTGWVRATGTISVPSISGKTIGTGSNLTVILGMPTSAGVVRNGTYDFWGWQLEYGSLATPFQTASGGSIQGELAMCQRYYWRENGGSNTPSYVVSYQANSASISGNNPVVMRITPSLTATYANANYGTAWNLAQPTRAAATKTGSVTNNYFASTQSWAICWDGGTFTPSPTAFQGISSQYIEASAEL